MPLMTKAIGLATATIVLLGFGGVSQGSVQMFWTDSGSVYRGNADGTGEKQQIYTASMDEVGWVGWVEADTQTQKLYMRGGSNAAAGQDGVIRRMNYDGSGVEEILAGLSIHGYGMALDPANDTMYFGDHPKGVFMANRDDGSNVTLLPDTSSDFDLLRHTHDIEVAGDKLYYTNEEHPAWMIGGIERFTGIRRSDLDGTHVEDIIVTPQGSAGFMCLAIDEVNGKLYWSQDTADSIFRSDLDGLNAETFLSGVAAYDLEIDPLESQLYFTTSWSSSYLGRINLDGTGLTRLFDLSSGDGVKGLALAPVAVPEPSALAVWSFLAIAGIGCGRWRTRRS